MAAGGAGANARLLAEDIAELALALVPWVARSRELAQHSPENFHSEIRHLPHWEPRMIVAMFEEGQKRQSSSLNSAIRSSNGEKFVAQV